MLKVMNLMDIGRHCLNALYQSIFDYMPTGKIAETKDIDEADLFFLFYYGGIPHCRVLLPDTYKGYTDVADLDKTIDALRTIYATPKIYWMDIFGKCMRKEVHRTYPDYISEKDVPIAIVPLPDHPHAKVINFIDEKKFYRTDSKRIKNSVTIIDDHVKTNIDTVVELLPYIDKLHVSACNNIEKADFYYKLAPWADKITCSKTTWPDGVRDTLNRHEFVLHLKDWLGQEIFGWEGAFCGAKPIYPDNFYYRECFKDNPGVALFDLKNPVDSILDIITSPNNWIEEHHQNFVERHAAHNHVPQFWNYIYENFY